MQSKGAIRFVAILLLLASLWQLSFTLVTNRQENKAQKYAEARASIEGQVDPLLGLKENVIMGRLIPCGTGARHLRNVQVIDADAEMEERSGDCLTKT